MVGFLGRLAAGCGSEFFFHMVWPFSIFVYSVSHREKEAESSYLKFAPANGSALLILILTTWKLPFKQIMVQGTLGGKERMERLRQLSFKSE